MTGWRSQGGVGNGSQKSGRGQVRALLLASIRPTAPYASRAAPEIRERHVQLTAQILASIEAITFLAQVLRLDLDRCMPLDLVARFSGKRFHQLLNFGHTGASSSEVLDPLMDVVVTGLHAEAFAEETSNKRRVGMGYGMEEVSPRSPPRGGKSNRRGGRRDFFFERRRFRHLSMFEWTTILEILYFYYFCVNCNFFPGIPSTIIRVSCSLVRGQRQEKFSRRARTQVRAQSPISHEMTR